MSDYLPHQCRGSARPPTQRPRWAQVVETRSSILGPSECVLGQDVGASTSKITLSLKKDHRAQIHRVSSHLPRDHPQNSDASTAGSFEFPSFAALREDGLHVGMASAESDEHFQLKHFLLYCAGITQEGVGEPIPGFPRVQEAAANGSLTVKDMRCALLEHLRLLKDLAVKQADEAGFHIGAISLTYPNYLCEDEESGDFKNYMSFYIELMKEVWPEILKFYWVSEGQSAATYLTEVFDDPAFATNARSKEQLYKDLKGEDGLNAVIADFGSTSMNVQVQTVRYTKGRPDDVKIQSSFGANWLVGKRGGSHGSNEEVLKFLKEELDPMIKSGRLPRGELAAFLQDFERQKKSLHYDQAIRDDRMIILHGRGTHNVAIEPKRLDQIFSTAFDTGLDALIKQIRLLIPLGKSFVVLCLGGSFSNPGLYDRMKAAIADIDSDAKRQGVSIRLAFLRDQEQWPSSAVSAGAALAVLNMPSPSTVLKGSAIGLQVMTPDDDSPGSWVGDNQAEFLFRPRCTELFSSVHNVGSYPGRQVIYNLVCDPTYRPVRRRHPRGGQKTIFHPIEIGPAQALLDGGISTYNLDWEVSHTDEELPTTGRYEFSLGGSRLERIAEGKDAPELEYHPIPFTITCNSLDVAGSRRKSRRDKRWACLLRTDPPSRLLTVETLGRLPVWCSKCHEALEGQARVCRDCESPTLCVDCYLSLEDYRGHKFKRVRLDI